MRKIAIIGGGAAGLAAAISAAQNGASVVIYEKNDRIGKKISLTGNGRCNLTNSNFSDTCYFSATSDRLKEWINSSNTEEVLSFFRDKGFATKKQEGRWYPRSEQAASVVEFFQIQLEQYDISLRLDSEIQEITVLDHQFQIHEEQYDSVIVAAGGCSYPKTGSDGLAFSMLKKLGIRLVDRQPALVPLVSSEKYFKSVAGIRVKANLKLWIQNQMVHEETGELQITEYGLSGIAIFQLSRLAAYALAKGEPVSVSVDVCPEYSKEELESYFGNLEKICNEMTFRQLLNGFLPAKLNQLFWKIAGIQPEERWAELPHSSQKRFLRLLKNWSVPICGTRGYEQAQVTAGGVDLKQVSRSFECKKYPGMYFAGEILDVDGLCGGYNLHFAFMSGIRAGRAAAGKEK